MFGKTREEAVLILLGLREHVSLFVQRRSAGLYIFSFFIYFCVSVLSKLIFTNSFIIPVPVY